MSIDVADIKAGENVVIVIDPDTFCLKKMWSIMLSVHFNGQHDGHLWEEKQVQEYESDLCDDVIEKMKPIVRDIIRKTDPFRCHAERQEWY